MREPTRWPVLVDVTLEPEVHRARAAGPRVLVLTAGHLSTCPRMLKVADALHAAGYRVRTVSARFVPWATSCDAEVMSSRSWSWDVVDYSRDRGNRLRLWSGARMRAAAACAAPLSAMGSLPLGVAATAYSRVHDELVMAATREPTDFVYAGTGPGLAAGAAAARRLRVPFALDLEDFHSGEQIDDRFRNQLAETIERRVLASARFLTTSSEQMAAAYVAKYRVAMNVVHNTFSLPSTSPPSPRSVERPLRLYWFSQTIGPTRGLEDVVRAAGLIDARLELHLTGRPDHAFVQALNALQHRVAPRLEIVRHDPISPDRLVGDAAPYDVGLGCEDARGLNRDLCLSNKLLTYVAAGLPVICTETSAQRAFAATLGAGAVTYRAHDIAALAAALRRFAFDRDALQRARAAARDAARTRWNWDHELERGRVVSLVDCATGRRCRS